jgi:hypothetical protein
MIRNVFSNFLKLYEKLCALIRILQFLLFLFFDTSDALFLLRIIVQRPNKPPDKPAFLKVFVEFCKKIHIKKFSQSFKAEYMEFAILPRFQGLSKG